MAKAPDPKIEDRMKNQPPFDKETPKEEEVKEEIVETPKETKEVVKEVIEEVKDVKKKVEKGEETKKRTAEQFDKLKEHNKELKEENKKIKKNVLDSLVPEAPQYPQSPITNVAPSAKKYPGLSQKQVNETFKGLVDDQGYVDSGLLVSTLKELKEKEKLSEERVRRAEAKAEQTTRDFDSFQRTQIMKEVHKKHPRLDPENSEAFDVRFWKGVRSDMVDGMMKGKVLDIAKVADDWAELLYGKEVKEVQEVKKKDKEKLEKAEDEKRNINALGTRQTSQRLDDTETEALHEAARRGKKGAVAALLREHEKHLKE